MLISPIYPASSGIRKIPNLKTFFEPEECAVVGWGRKKSGGRARLIAKLLRRPHLLLEDGFLRSVGRQDAPLSVVVDDLGIYYDANMPSRLERLIGQPLSQADLERTRGLLSLWRKHRVSKYNHAPECLAKLPKNYVLVIDQTFGDASVEYGLANKTSFDRMLEAASAENLGSNIVIKMHPDRKTKQRQGYFQREALPKDGRFLVIDENYHPCSLIERAKTVYTVSSQVGFEGLIWDRPVRTFGMPFYAGWGLTYDDLAQPSRRHNATLKQVVHSALIKYTRYLSPDRQHRCQIEDLIPYLDMKRNEIQKEK